MKHTAVRIALPLSTGFLSHMIVAHLAIGAYNWLLIGIMVGVVAVFVRVLIETAPSKVEDNTYHRPAAWSPPYTFPEAFKIPQLSEQQWREMMERECKFHEEYLKRGVPPYGYPKGR